MRTDEPDGSTWRSEGTSDGALGRFSALLRRTLARVRGAIGWPADASGDGDTCREATDERAALPATAEGGTRSKSAPGSRSPDRDRATRADETITLGTADSARPGDDDPLRITGEGEEEYIESDVWERVDH